MREEEDEAIFFSSRRRTTSSRRPGTVFDRPVQVRIVKVEPCELCGGTRERGSSKRRSVHYRLARNGRDVDCAGRAVWACGHVSCGGWHLEGELCPLQALTP